MPIGVYPRRYLPLADRFWPKVIKTDGCWLWTGARIHNGYGSINNTVAHRVAWELTYGPIPDGVFVCHRCDNPPCVKPDHLFLGTRDDNTADMLEKSRQAHGAGKRNAKLTDDTVRSCRTRFANGETMNALAREYGTSSPTMWMAVTGRTWKHVI